MIFIYKQLKNRNYSTLSYISKRFTFAKNFKNVMKTKELLMRDTALVLRGLRRKKSEEAEINLTQADIAYGAGISVRYYNKLENGKTLPTIDTLAKIADTYKMSLADICKQIEDY